MELIRKNLLLVVILSAIAIFSCLAISVWDINFWPTDAKVFYFKPAIDVPNLTYISEIHKFFNDSTTPYMLHGKELFILFTSIIQRIMNDVVTLKPLIVLCLLSLFLSSILVFLIIRKYLGEKIGLICYLIFVTSFWPYVYVLFAKHQPLGLMFFLFAVFSLNIIRSFWSRHVLCFLSGAFFCAAVFSSTVSALYLPYYAVVFLHAQYVKGDSWRNKKGYIFRLLVSGLMCLLGALIVIVYINYPDVSYNLSKYLEYIGTSSGENHFTYNQAVLQYWIPENIPETHGGWTWIFRYFLLIMPVVFPFYLLCLVYLVFKLVKKYVDNRAVDYLTLIIILLGISSPVLAEVKRVAQYGANYFTAFVGIILTLGYAFHIFIKEDYTNSIFRNLSLLSRTCLLFLPILHIFMNLFVFVNDIYPTRMATTFLSKKIEELGITKLYTYKTHPHKEVFTENLSPDVMEKIDFELIDNISQVKDGYILVPPISKDSIFLAAQSSYKDYDDDMFLNELRKKDVLEKYSVGSFKTLVSSLIWPHEEEILTYRYLVLGHYPQKDVDAGKVWILDAKKLANDIRDNIPRVDDLYLMKNDIRNIGKIDKIYNFRGNVGVLKQPANLDGFAARIYKVGDPKDGLILYAYERKKVDKREHTVWAPYAPNNMSKVFKAENMTSDRNGGLVSFVFDPPLEQKEGLYLYKIYRTGPSDDENYYRIYTKNQIRVGK